MRFIVQGRSARNGHSVSQAALDRHSYATWMLEEGADLRYVKDQMGHASIEETEGTYGHLARERHEQRVDLGVFLELGR